MTITYLRGDATAPTTTGRRIICHVCNDSGGWGRGFVLALSQRWAQPEAEYRAWHERGEAGGLRLGAIQIVEVAPNLHVANLVAQHGTRAVGGVPPIRYEALRSCLEELARRAAELEASVHMPRIGCGLAGGSWPEVEAIINGTLVRTGVPVHVYDL